MAKMNSDRFILLDLETTGLNPAVHNVLECACIVTDGHLQPLEIETWLFHFDYKPSVHQGFDPKVVEMHTKNGLWDECRAAPRGKTSEERIALWQEVEGFLLEMRAQDAPLVTCNPVFEREWLQYKAPNVGSLLHYRSIDVNGFYLLERVATGGAGELKSNRIHRGLEDLLADLDVCQKWLRVFQAHAALGGK
jgi:oligoribonuclease